MARLRGCEVLFVSVGAGPLYSAVGRLLVKSALFLATYRSYRDDSSLNYLKAIGFRTKQDRVYPDLVFSLPETLLTATHAPLGRKRVVGLGLMMYPGRYSVDKPAPETYIAYLEALVVFAQWLLSHGYDIRLFLSDADTPAIQEFKSLLRARLGKYNDARVIYQPVSSVPEILSLIAATDVVVATRFHSVLFAMLLTKPVIAVSFHHKCSSLMSDMGLADYCHDIHEIDADKLIEQFERLETHSQSVKHVIEKRVQDRRQALDEQYDVVFGACGRGRAMRRRSF